MKYTLILLIFFKLNITFGQINHFTEVVEYYHTEKNFNGVILVATDGKIDYINGVGVANRQTGSKINSKTKFKIASITKAFTAVLILQLYQQGKIDLQTPFGKYFPTYKGNAKNSVTIENLLTYSSGIPDEIGKLEMETFKSPLTLDDYIDKYCSKDIVGTPGEKSNYSNTEYIILTKIIEILTQKSYETVLKENILKPLKMNNSGLINSKFEVSEMTKSYSIDDSTKTANLDEEYFAQNYFGAGAMYSTAKDLLKFNTEIFKGKLLNKDIAKLMIKPNSKLNNTAFGVWYADGYGTFSKPFIYRTGGILGSCSNWIYTLDDKKSIIVFNNTNGTNLYEMSEQLYLVAKGQKPTITKK